MVVGNQKVGRYFETNVRSIFAIQSKHLCFYFSCSCV